MFRIALGLILAGLLASPSAAALIRVDVTGSVSGFYNYEFAIDKSDDLNWVDLGPGTIALSQVPEGTTGATFAGITTRTTGSFVYSTAGSFSECTGFFAEICGPANLPTFFGEQFAFDEALDIFEFEANFVCCAFLSVGPGGFRYIDDGIDSFTLGSIDYLLSSADIEGTFTSMTVTAVPVPGAATLLLAAIGALVTFRRRRAVAV
jgi:hypothetical protein